MSGAVVWSGSSSMVIDMAVRLVSQPDPWITASFTFVARSPQTGRAAKINRLVPEMPVEEARFEEIEVLNQKRKAKRLVAAAAAGGKGVAGANANHGKAAGFNKEAMAQLLLTQARPLLEMPCLADPTCVLVDHTKLSNSTVMQPQQRNMLSRIFGGFLMRVRGLCSNCLWIDSKSDHTEPTNSTQIKSKHKQQRAYEIAFATAYLFGGTRPSFFEVAHVVS